jgi:hypothetical protein
MRLMPCITLQAWPPSRLERPCQCENCKSVTKPLALVTGNCRNRFHITCRLWHMCVLTKGCENVRSLA